MAHSAKVRLTKKLVEALEPPRVGSHYAWDSELHGFGVAVYPSGTRSFIVDYTTPAGTRRRRTVGRCDVLSLQQARTAAQQILADVVKGRDVGAERDALRAAPTVADLAKRYLTEHAEKKKKPSSVRVDRTNLANHVLPALGRMKVREVDYEHVEALHASMGESGRRGAANRVVALLSKMFNLAERWKLRDAGSNPCRHVERFPEKQIHRVLTPDDLGRLGAVFNASTANADAVAAIRLLLLTGCRRNEVLKLRWEEVDLDAGELRLADSKTGAKVVTLNGPAVALIRAQESRVLLGNPFVFPSRTKPRKPLHDVNGQWYKLRAAAGLEDVRLHDLRHTVGATGTATGAPLQMVGALLGHKTAATTHRYAKPDVDPKRAAAELIGQSISSALDAHGVPAGGVA